MSKTRLALALAFALGLSLLANTFARADYSILDGNGHPQTIKAGTLGTCNSQPCILPWWSPVDAGGNAFGIAGNPFFVSPAPGATFNINCASGCTGGGGGGLSVAFGGAIGANGTPGGFKDGSGNFQSFLGDTTNGQWVFIKNSSIGVTGTFWPYTLGQQVAGSSVPVVLPAAQVTALTPPAAITNYAQETGGNLAQLSTDVGPPGATACTSDTASCNQNQQLQRLAQRLTSIVTALGSPFQAGGSIGNTGFNGLQGGSALSATNGWYTNILQGNAAISATNGLYANLLQGNAVLSATNGIYTNLLQSNAALSASNPLPGNMAQMGGTAINSGCVAALSGFSTTIPSTVCGVFGSYVLNSNANGAAAASASSPVTLPILNHASTTSLGTSLVAKASAGNLNSFNCSAITGGAAGYCIAYNGTSAPATGALTGANVLDWCYFDTTARGCSLSHLNGSISFSSGIVILTTSAVSPYTYTTGTDTAAIEADYN